MAVSETTDSLLFLKVAENERVILKDHTDECGVACINFRPVYKALSEDTQYKKIAFLAIDADSNPVAMRRILDKRQPFVTIYFKRKLLDSKHTSTKEGVTLLLEELLNKA